MSRAFTKEDDAGEDLPERPIPDGPNYVTPRGLELLREAGCDIVERRKKAAAENGDLRPFDRDLRYLEARIKSAVVVPPGSGSEARFGARVTIEDDSGRQQTFQIVGDDEARTNAALLSWSAPLASALFGVQAGDRVLWEGGETPVTYRIVSVDYPL